VRCHYSPPSCTSSISTALCAATTRLPAAAALPQLRCASRCFGSSSRPSSTTSLRRASGGLDSSRGLSSTTSPTLHVRVPRHVARLVAPFVVNFDYATRPGATARRAARRAARRRLLRLRCASGCLGTSRGSLSISLTTPHVRVPRHVARLVVDYSVRSRHGVVGEGG
jgi:hypothetical protein